MTFITQVRNMWDIDQGENVVIQNPAIIGWNSYIKWILKGWKLTRFSLRFKSLNIEKS